MKLWLLEPIERGGPIYDVACAFVVRAETGVIARKMASEECGDEAADYWISPERSSCVELTACGDAGIIIRDFNAG